MNKLNEQVEEYLEFLKIEKGLKNNTIQAYQQDLTEFVAFLEKEGISSWPSEVVDINAFLSRQTETKAANSVKRIISSLNKFYQWLARNGIQRLNPMLEVDAPKKVTTKPVVLTKEEVTILLNQPDINKKLGIRDRALLEVLYATGIKASELINLKLTDVHDDLQLIQVFDGNRSRLIPINQEAIKWVKKYNQEVRKPLVLKKGLQSDYLFLNNRGTQITRQAIWQIIKKYCKNANIQKDVTPHTLRHTFTTHLLQNGADLQVVHEILGYSDNNNLYKQLTQKKILQVYQKTHPRVGE